ncbi:hypothetical protein [Streptacidiphilus pinicola]|uniref:hypothetical protein n=1 Tax=Streptacidiphilus pinicola TaxID=2219663 RepID=UPI0014033ECE|nr:hypothetical protein [Streptacidiphilus pinicola]
MSAADVHQLLSYSAGYTSAAAPASVIVHPQPDRHAHSCRRWAEISPRRRRRP